MRKIKKNHRVYKMTNAIDPATSTNKNWGHIPAPNKGGATTNWVCPDWMFERELREMEENGGVAIA